MGTRISEESHLRPKPMVEIGGRPILWHVMKIYAHHGIERFRRLPRLQGLRDQGIFLQLLPARLRRDHRRADQSHHIPRHPRRALAHHAGRHRRTDADRRTAEARRALSRPRRAVLLHLWRRRRRYRHRRRNRLPPPPRPQGDAHRRRPAGPLRRAVARRRPGRALHREAARRPGLHQRRLLRARPLGDRPDRRRRHALGRRRRWRRSPRAAN